MLGFNVNQNLGLRFSNCHGLSHIFMERARRRAREGLKRARFSSCSMSLQSPKEGAMKLRIWSWDEMYTVYVRGVGVGRG